MSDDFDDVLRRFRREMLGPMVAHMDDGQVERWLQQFAPPPRTREEAVAEFPYWLQQRLSEERVRLLRVMGRRG